MAARGRPTIIATKDPLLQPEHVRTVALVRCSMVSTRLCERSTLQELDHKNYANAEERGLVFPSCLRSPFRHYLELPFPPLSYTGQKSMTDRLDIRPLKMPHLYLPDS